MELAEKKRKRPKIKTTFTTGDIAYNIKQFNKHMGTDFPGNDNSNPSAAEAQANAAAIAAAESTGTFAAPSVDGGNSVEMGGNGGAGLSESIDSTMPVKILSTDVIKDYVRKLIPTSIDDKRPPQFFKLGYIRELTREIAAKYKGGRGSDGLPKIRIFKCVEYSKLYTGKPITSTNDTRAADKVLGTARHTGERTGFVYDDKSLEYKIGKYEKSGEYALQVFIANDSRQKVKYYISENDGDLRAATKDEVATYFTPESAASLLGTKVRPVVATTTDGASLYDKMTNRIKLNGIYMIGTLGTPLLESLDLCEEKRYVRRYYIRPFNIFCSNKNDIIQALIDHADQDCIIYTLNNLGDVKDVTKLTNKDIIYIYKDNALYDKNYIRIMDYDLYVKHEEERKRIDPEKASDSTFMKVYQDRITDLTRTDESFELEFPDINVYGEKLVEGKALPKICCICGEEIEGYGNNPEPYKSAENGERCCDSCNIKFVIPARLEQIENEEITEYGN